MAAASFVTLISCTSTTGAERVFTIAVVAAAAEGDVGISLLLVDEDERVGFVEALGELPRDT